MSLTNFDPHRHSRSRQYGFLPRRPDLCAQSWPRQCISVGLGMFLLLACRAQIEVQRDGDKWSHLAVTRSHCVLQRHLLFLSVETFPWTSSQMVPAPEGILGLHDLFKTILLFHPRSGIYQRFTPFAVNTSFALNTRFAKLQGIVNVNDFRLFRKLEEFSFCTDKSESIKWVDLEPRQRIGDCFEIHFPRWGFGDLLFSSHQTFLLEAQRRQCVLCKEPLSFWFANILRISIFWEACVNTVLPGYHFRRTFRIWVVRSVCDCWHFCGFEIVCELLSHSKRSRKRFPAASWSHRKRAGLEKVLDESCGNDVEDELRSWKFGMYSKTMWNKQRFFWPEPCLNPEFQQEQLKNYRARKFVYLFVALWHGGSCQEMCGTILWVGKQDDSTTLQSINSMHWWPSLQRRRNEICWRIVTSMLSNGSQILVCDKYWKFWYSMISK